MGCCTDKIRETNNKKSNIKKHKFKKKNIKNIQNNDSVINHKNDESYIRIDKYNQKEISNNLDNDNLTNKEDDEKENSLFYISRVLETPIQIINQSKINKIGKFPEDKKPPQESKVIRYKKKESFSDSI